MNWFKQYEYLSCEDVGKILGYYNTSYKEKITGDYLKDGRLFLHDYGIEVTRGCHFKLSELKNKNKDIYTYMRHHHLKNDIN